MSVRSLLDKKRAVIVVVADRAVVRINFLQFKAQTGMRREFFNVRPKARLVKIRVIEIKRLLARATPAL
jgi:hypothetical protein